MRALLLVAVLALPLAGCFTQQGDVPVGCASRSETVDVPPGEEVVFVTGDGVELHGTYWQGADGKHAAVMVHGLNEDRRAWQPLWESLVQKGFAALAFDLRGHGQSTTRNGQAYELRNFTRDDFLAMERDVEAAVELVKGRSDPPCIAVVGASIGANLALRVGVSEGSVDAVAMLSPGVDYRGVRTEDAAQRFAGALFLAAARGDVFSAQSAQVLAGQSGNETLVLVEGEAHGTELLRVADVQSKLVEWLVRVA